MCKFNQNLFIVWCCIWLVVIKAYHTSPVDFMLLDDIIDDESPSNGADHDLTYDQRQNGTENIRLRVDGVIIAFPSSSSSQASSAAGNIATNYLLQLAAGGDEDSDEADYFPFLKNSNNEHSVTALSAPTEKDASKDTKKKSSPKEPGKEGGAKRVVIVKEGVKAENSEVAPSQPTAVGTADEQSKFEVIPVKKVQSRRKNKHKLRLAGLLDFLQRYREQY